MKFSITIPTYKNQYLKEAIDSVLCQSYNNFELIIVNDASPFDIESIVSHYSDYRIRYFVNEHNCGARNVVDNWNICLSHVEGDYILCMGDDDKLTPNCLQDYADAIKKHPDVELFHAGTEVINEKSEVVEKWDIRPEKESVYQLIMSTQGTGLGSYLYKTETLRKVGGFYKLPYGWTSDYITYYLVAQDHGVVHLQTIGFQYRGNSQSISYDMKCVEDKIMCVQHYGKWVHSFLTNTNPSKNDDITLKNQILNTIEETTSNKIDGLMEFDIRKQLLKRSLFWLKNRKKYDISMSRYIRILIKGIRYKYK